MSTNPEDSSNSMLNQAGDLQPRQLQGQSASKDKPVIIGLYGIPGSGKTFLLEQLSKQLGEEIFTFYEGSEVIDSIVPGGLEAFQTLDEAQKMFWRQLAIETIGNKCKESHRAGVVAGHFMFWAKDEEVAHPAYTQNDLETFTHILYLDIPAEVVKQRRDHDKKRERSQLSIDRLRDWQHAEKTQLRQLCRQYGILFSLISLHMTTTNKISLLLQEFRHHTETENMSLVRCKLDEIIALNHHQLETVLVMDADRTLAAEDTGALYWTRTPISQLPAGDTSPLKTLFSSSMGYSYGAFLQATLLYEEAANDAEFDAFCEDVALAVTMYPDFIFLLRKVAEQKHIGAVIVTCGLRRVWEKVLKREGLSETVKVIGGGRIADHCVVTSAVKSALVEHLQRVHHIYVWAFGDSVLDMEMLSMADQAIVVVGKEKVRSKTMDASLVVAIANGSLRARQVVLPRSASPRLDTTRLPIVELTEHDFLQSIFSHHPQASGLQIRHATDTNMAKLLMTPMRDANVAGPALREAHRRVGSYLATEFLADMVGIEEHPIPHVQGHNTSGYRLCHEKQTLIVALMRGGEPMAFGVNDVFPLAMFLHAKDPNDIRLGHLHGLQTVVLVDSVVNSGKTVVEFVKHIRNLHGTIRIVVITGVVQSQFISGGSLQQGLTGHEEFNLIALRVSDNRFTGRGNTDTGNRLFNTTHLP